MVRSKIGVVFCFEKAKRTQNVKQSYHLRWRTSDMFSSQRMDLPQHLQRKSTKMRHSNEINEIFIDSVM